VQPARARPLLSRADDGLPQRFIWAPVLDPDVTDAKPADPGPLDITVPS